MAHQDEDYSGQQPEESVHETTGIHLSNILGEAHIIWGENVVKPDKCISISQLSGCTSGLPPKVHACA